MLNTHSIDVLFLRNAPSPYFLIHDSHSKCTALNALKSFNGARFGSPLKMTWQSPSITTLISIEVTFNGARGDFT
jgi:uncharacterized protein YprB with RNaseH-like and TPR domain